MVGFSAVAEVGVVGLGVGVGVGIGIEIVVCYDNNTCASGFVASCEGVAGGRAWGCVWGNRGEMYKGSTSCK